MKERRTVLSAGAALLLLAHAAWAAPINTNGNIGVGRTLSARALKNVKMNVMLGVNYGPGGDMVQGPVDYDLDIAESEPALDSAGTEVPTREVVDAANMLSGNFSVAMGVAKIWDIAASVPFYYDWLGFGELAEGGMGDPEISTKICIPPAGDIWYNAFYLAGTIPVGTSEGLLPRWASYENLQDTVEPAANFYNYGGVSLKPMWLMTLDFSTGKKSVPIAMHLNFGAHLPFDGSGRYLGVGGFSFQYTPAEFISLFVDFNMEQRLDNISGDTFFRDPAFVTPGIIINTPAGLYLKLAGDFCVSRKNPVDREEWRTGDYIYSTQSAPTFGVQFAFGWQGFLNVQDADKDGVKDDIDRCPKDAEDIDGFEDSDGCPDEDNDSDGKPDKQDKCPNEAEDDDGFEDEDGCPDPDNDKDGIVDEKDKCPKDPEDFDGFEDKDGCPDPDNDKDGVPDSLDRCPNDPEDFDKFEDDDGCADIDNDKDGIPDLKDKCPNKPETFNEIDDSDGCPDVKKKESKMPKHQILRGVEFQSGSPTMTVQSYRFLEPIIKEMLEYPDIEVEIRGHTDSVGKYDTNMKLSQMRAESVMQYFISKGIDPNRMRARGYGPSSPIADNRTAAGRRANRRIEVVRLK